MEGEDPSTLLNLCQPLHVAAEEHPIQPQAYDIVVREVEVFERRNLSLWGCVTNDGIHLEQETVVRVCSQQQGEFLAYTFTHGPQATQGFSVVLGRERQNNDGIPVVYVCVSLWKRPFKGIAWKSTCGKRHFLGSEDRFESIPSPFPKVKIEVKLHRVRMFESDAINQGYFIDVIDLHVKEAGKRTSMGDAKIIHVTGTIQKTLEYGTQSPLHNRWKDKLPFKTANY